LNKKLLVIIAGPTGVGKTSVGIELAQKFSSEIISCDSRQFFKELKIGTAAPTEEELQKITHHLVGNISIEDYYNAYMFDKDANAILSSIFEKNDVAFVVGGSGMYVNALTHGIDEIPDIDPDLREEVSENYRAKGIDYLRQQLKLLDPEYYSSVDLKNPKRLIRAVEVCLHTGKTYSSFRKSAKKELPYSIVSIYLELPREELYERINKRVDQMMELGLEEEARAYYHKRKLNALNTVGYKELFDYFDGTIGREKAIELIKRNSRHYAKKQLSWFKRNDEAHWFSPLEIDKMKDLIKRTLLK